MAKPKKATPAAPRHPLMLNGKEWDRAAVMKIICAAISGSSNSLGTILTNGYNGFRLPTYTAICEWLAEDDRIAEIYARAKQDQADYMADELVAIADERETKVVIDGEETTVVFDSVAVQRNKLRVDARKWVAAKLKPRKYGDRVQQEHTGAGGGPIQTFDIAQFMAALKGVSEAELDAMEATLRKALESK